MEVTEVTVTTAVIMALAFILFLFCEMICWSDAKQSLSAVIVWSVSKKWFIIKQDKKFSVACKLRFMFFHYKWKKLNAYNTYETPEQAQEELDNYQKQQLAEKQAQKAQKLKDKITEIKIKPKINQP